MKIIHTVESYLPARHGMQEVVTRLSEGLSRLGHDVSIVTRADSSRTKAGINGVKIYPFKLSGCLANGVEGDQQSYKDFLLNGDYDVIVNFAAQQWATDVMLPILPRLKAKKVFVPTGFSGLHNPLFHDYYRKMQDWIKLYDASVFLSNNYQDIEFARKNGARNVVVIPNGASKEEFFPLSPISIKKHLQISKDNMLLLHVGSYTGAKGHDEAIKIFSRSKLPPSTLLLVGQNEGYFKKKRKAVMFSLLNKFNSFKGKQVISTSLSRAETVAAFQQADLFLFPSQLECSPIVLFEAMAGKTPFLATDVGNTREIIQWSGSGVLLPTHKKRKGFCHAHVGRSAKILSEMASDCKKMIEMAQEGHRVWQEKFTWEQITKQYETLYQRLLNEA